jgi:hypothetical protein
MEGQKRARTALVDERNREAGTANAGRCEGVPEPKSTDVARKTQLLQRIRNSLEGFQSI